MNRKILLALLLLIGMLFVMLHAPFQASDVQSLKLFLIVWISCAVVTTIVWCSQAEVRKNFFGPDRLPQAIGQRLRVVAATLLVFLLRDLFLWPIFLVMALFFILPPILSKIGLRARWKELAPGESSFGSWTTKEGRKFAAEAKAGYEGTAIISAECPEWPHGAVEFRLRRIAPEQGDFIEWRQIERLSTDEWAEVVEADRATFEQRPYESQIVLSRAGKFMVEFRVENQPGRFEDFSGVILIVN